MDCIDRIMLHNHDMQLRMKWYVAVRVATGVARVTAGGGVVVKWNGGICTIEPRGLCAHCTEGVKGHPPGAWRMHNAQCMCCSPGNRLSAPGVCLALSYTDRSIQSKPGGVGWGRAINGPWVDECLMTSHPSTKGSNGISHTPKMHSPPPHQHLTRLQTLINTPLHLS